FAVSLQTVYPRPGSLRRKGEETPIHGPVSLFEALMAAGRKGITMQRYKGLGEMNPGQLWETTLDTNARSLLQVKIKELDDADDIFVRLMGEEVEPRRQFIQDNALTASVDVEPTPPPSGRQAFSDHQSEKDRAQEQHHEDPEQDLGDAGRG